MVTNYLPYLVPENRKKGMRTSEKTQLERFKEYFEDLKNEKTRIGGG